MNIPHLTRRLALVGIALALQTPLSAQEAGKPAPTFEITTLNGQRFKSDDTKGEVVIVNFWATWCTFCREEMPALETYFRRHRSEGLRVLAISMDDPEDDAKVREIMATYSYSGALARQGNLKGFGRIWRLPMTFVIDRQGVLRNAGSLGDTKVDLAALESKVTPLLKSPGHSSGVGENPHH